MVDFRGVLELYENSLTLDFFNLISRFTFLKAISSIIFTDAPESIWNLIFAFFICS